MVEQPIDDDTWPTPSAREQASTRTSLIPGWADDRFPSLYGMSPSTAVPEPRDRPRERMGGVDAVLSDQLEIAHRAGQESRLVVLVEGVSDQRAIETLARRHERDLVAEGVAVIPIAGATNARRFLRLLGPQGYDVGLAGLYDQGETGLFRRGLEEAGLGVGPTDADMQAIGFFVCVRDLEDELIRSLGAAAVEAVIEERGALRAFRSFQNQPAQRGKPVERQLWRWMGNRKISFAELLVEALDLDRSPPPLQGLLDRI